jgi:hypothetical protein
MTTFKPMCPKCDKPMQLGHLPDVAHGMVLQASWSEGEPVPRRFIGGIKYAAQMQIPLQAYRCPACGLVELYARPS